MGATPARGTIRSVVGHGGVRAGTGEGDGAEGKGRRQHERHRVGEGVGRLHDDRAVAARGHDRGRQRGRGGDRAAVAAGRILPVQPDRSGTRTAGDAGDADLQAGGGIGNEFRARALAEIVDLRRGDGGLRGDQLRPWSGPPAGDPSARGSPGTTPTHPVASTSSTGATIANSIAPPPRQAARRPWRGGAGISRPRSGKRWWKRAAARGRRATARRPAGRNCPAGSRPGPPRTVPGRPG